MNDIMRNHGQKKNNRGRKTGAAKDKNSAALQAEEPLSRRRRAKNAAADADSGRLLQINEEAARHGRQERRSLLKGLFGFLGSQQDQAAEETEESEEFSAPARTGWTPQEKRMLANIAELHEARVADIMIPRSDIEALDLDRTLAEALQLFEQSGHSRMPVYTETLDDPRGMIHIRDLLNYITRANFGSSDTGINAGGNGKNGAKNEGGKADKAFAALDLNMPISRLGIMRDVLFVPASMQAGRLLARMQASRTQMALVIDEHGGTDGLVSMEDIVELIVGDIEDEHDDEDADIVKEAQDSWIIDAAAELEELKDSLGIDFAENLPTEGVDTLGGLIVTALDRIPARGEKVEIMPDYIFQILDADRRRIKRIRLIRLESQADA